MTAPTRLAVPDVAAVLRRALAEGRVGAETPAAVFHDMAATFARLDALERAFPAGSLHAVAIKANPVVPLLRRLVSRGAGLEAATREEVALALAAGCAPDSIVYDSPAKTESDLAFALSRGVRVNLDNLDELARAAALHEALHATSAVGLRINPLTGEGAIAATSVAGRRSQFGVPLTAPDDERLLAAFARHPWLTGLHVHTGSQGCSLDQLVGSVRAVDGLRRAIDARLGAGRVSWLDIGGGLPVAYTDADVPPTSADYAGALAAAVPDLFASGVRLVTEFGRHVLANAGWAATRVEYVKAFEGHRVAIGHLGADMMLRQAYRPEDWPLEVHVLDAGGHPKPTERLSSWTIAGPLCFSGDMPARDRPLPDIEAGDWVIFRDAGAYTLSMWSRHCSRGMPPVYAYTSPDGPFELLKAAESPDDIVRFWGGTP